MNIQAFCEIVQSRLGAFDQDSIYDDREVLAIADGCRGVLIAQEYSRTGEYPTGDFIREYEVDLVPYRGNMKKFQLPVTIANGVNNLGIPSVTNIEPPFTNWVPLAIQRLPQFKEEDFGGRTVYALQGQEVLVANPNGAMKALIRLIPCLLELDQDDEIFGNSLYEGMIADQVVEKLRLKKDTPEIKQNDGGDNV